MVSLGQRFTRCFLLALAVLTGCVQETSDTESLPDEITGGCLPVETLTRALSREQLEARIRLFCRNALGREAISVRPVGDAFTEEYAPGCFQVYRFTDHKSDSNSITVDLYTGFVRTCYLGGDFLRDDNVLQETTPRQLSSEEVLEVAKPVLQWYDKTLNRADYSVALFDNVEPCTEWLIRGEMRYKGIPCRGRGLRVHVSRFAPEVTRVWSTGPIIPPDRHVVTVTRCEALHIAATFMAELDEVRRQGMQYELPEEIGAITEIITPPLNMGFSSMEEPTERGYLAHKLYYAWYVPVIVILDGKRIDCFVSVDTETGEIIYGGREKQERRAKTSESGE